MIKTIPEKKECYCDRCNERVKDEHDFAGKGNVQINGRDASGVFVGGPTMSLELCDSCAYALVDWRKGKGLTKGDKT